MCNNKCDNDVQNNIFETKLQKKDIYNKLNSITTKKLMDQGQLKWNLYPDCIGAWVAETDYGTSPKIEQTLIHAIKNNLLGYAPNGLIENLKTACAQFQKNTFGWDIKKENIFPLPDVLTCLHIMLDNFIPANSKVVVLTPAYMPFLRIPQEHGHEIIEIQALIENEKYVIDYSALEDAFKKGAKLLILCNPWNPIGRVLRKEELEKISKIISKYNALVFSDEIHSPLVIDPNIKLINYASLNEETHKHSITATAASKGWNIAGLKSAQAIITNKDLAEKFNAIAEKYIKNMPPIGMMATISAYTDTSNWIDIIKEYINDNAQFLQEKLNKIQGVHFIKNEGTYLAWIKLPSINKLKYANYLSKVNTNLDLQELQNSENIAEVLRKTVKIAVITGRACGTGYDDYIRFNLAMPRPVLQECIEKLEEFINLTM